jgi:hypothetical protein
MAYTSSGFDDNQYGYENERTSAHMNIRPMVDPDADGEVNPDL